MKRAVFVLAWATLVAAPLAACNDVGDCNGQTVKPGGSCSGDQLECPYTLRTESPACDGTMVEGGLQTSCTCQNGTWSCPSPISCDATSAGDASQQNDGMSPADAADASTAAEMSTDGPAEGAAEASAD